MVNERAVKALISDANSSLKPDAEATYLGFTDGVVRIRFAQATDASCTTCVLEPDDFQEMMFEMLHAQYPEITEVQLEQETVSS